MDELQALHVKSMARHIREHAQRIVTRMEALEEHDLSDFSIHQLIPSNFQEVPYHSQAMQQVLFDMVPKLPGDELVEWPALTEKIDVAEKIIDLVKQKDGAYAERNQCIALAARLSQLLGFVVGIKEHSGEEWEDEWRNVLFIELPTGQVSWHLHQNDLPFFPDIPVYEGNWDNHTTEEKYTRIHQYVKHPHSEQEKETK